jgi:parvulin-like peptidyl-prolyl isomerase
VKKLSAVFAVLVLAGLCGCSFTNSEDVLAEVNGKKITKEDLHLRAGLYSVKFAAADEAESFLNGMINDDLILLQAEKDGIKVDGNELDTELKNYVPGISKDEVKKIIKKAGIHYGYWLGDIRQKITIKKEINHVMQAKVKTTPAELKDFYWTHILTFRTLRTVRARQIVTSTLETAQLALLKINNKEPFEELAKKYSITSDAADGGDLGYFKEGDMPAFMNVIFRLKKGTVSPIIKSPYGFHIFKCEDIKEAQSPKYEEAKEEVAERFLDEKKDEFFGTWMKELREKAKIKAYPEHLNMMLEEAKYGEN